jgi:uncharacterized protein
MSNRNSFDTLAPEFRLLINGRELEAEAKANLIGVGVLDDLAAASMFWCTVLSWDAVMARPRWIDGEPFREGNSVEVQMGYRDSLQSLFKGEITALEPAFVHHQPPTLTVRGYDRRHRLMRKRKTHSYRNMKDSEIASQVAAAAGLSAQVQDSGVTLDYVLQHNQTDLEFLGGRARRIGYEVKVMDRTLCFHGRKNNEGETLKLTCDVELLEFYPRLTTVGQVEQVEVRGWDPKGKKELVAQTSSASTLMGGSTSGPQAASQVFQETGGVCVSMPVESQAEADQLAKGWFDEMALSHVTGSGLCIGEPRLRAGTVVKLEGLGKRFSGAYYVVSAEHDYKRSTGYRTAFTVRRNAT